MHQHRCATEHCPNYYVCHTRDCRLDWTCPRHEDDELFADIERQNQDSLNRNRTQQEQTRHG